ncbi:MAG: hypothetical protein HY516_01620 [Candidatus Aenigmarchaeota archaeon]|nr:hypothetical protein [Candidatus Aenigmarchaeota archaeon]
MKAGLLFAAIAVVVIVSGCNDNPDIPQAKNNDVVVLENVEAVPNEVRPERSFVLSGFVANKATTKMNGVRVELADYCSSVFDVVKTSCALSSSDGYDGCTFNLNLDASSKFQWSFKSPPPERTAGRDFDCNMAVKTTFSYTAHGSVGAILANDAEIAARETGPTPVTGDGPVKIYMTVETAQPIGRGETFDVKIILKDEGGGELESPIARDKFRYSTAEGISGKCDVPQTITITKAKRESDPIFCSFTTPNTLPPRVTKFVTADADYSYKSTSTVPVKLTVTKQN